MTLLPPYCDATILETGTELNLDELDQAEIAQGAEIELYKELDNTDPEADLDELDESEKGAGDGRPPTQTET